MLCLCVAVQRGRRWAAVALVSVLCSPAFAAEPARLVDTLSPEEWRQLDTSVDAGLAYLATQQQPDGSFRTQDLGQPGISSLCVLAYLSRGHVPQEGQYGETLDRAIRYVLGSRQPDGMLFAFPIQGRTWRDRRHKIGAYNHAIAGVMLAEVYGMTQGALSKDIGVAIRRALSFSRAEQLRVKTSPDDEGGWRYLVRTDGPDSDLSITAWEIMFLRSARNAEFEVPVESIDGAMQYVRRTYVPETGTFAYGTAGLRQQQTRAMAGSGILLLALGGEHNTDMAHSAGKWILEHPFDRYQRVIYGAEHYHYGAYYCSQAMFQLGGLYWEQFFPPFMQLHVANQQADGSWPPEMNRDGEFGSVFTTSLMVLSLTPAYQLLPIYQR